MNLLFTYHPAWLLLATVVAFIYSFYLYRKDELLEDVSKTLKWILAIARFAAVWLIFVLLLGIIFEKLVDRKEKPLVFIAHDTSESIILNKDSSFYRNEYLDNLNQLSDNLSANFEVLEYNFSSELKEGLTADYSGDLTDISTVFNQIFDQYTNRNIGTIILSSDGLYNTGSNPIYALARKSFLPVYTVGLGDTNQVRDVKIEVIKHNDIAFLGNQFPVDVIISQNKAGGEKVKVSISKNGKLINSKGLQLKGKEQQLTANFILTANQIGYQKYTVEVSTVKNEFSYKNNRANFYVDVIDGRQKILIAHNGPHPDISSLRYVIEGNKNYEVKVSDMDEVKDVSPYDLVVLHNYQSGNDIIDKSIKAGSIPCLFMVGNQTDMRDLQAAEIGISGNRTDLEEVGFSHNPAFKEIILSADIVNTLSDAPPIQAPFGNFNFSSAINVLAYQKIGNIVLDKPLIYFTKKSASRYGVIMGEGIWRWRLHDQFKNDNTENFEAFISKLITFLAIKDNKDPFKVNIDREYSESEKVKIEAELYNQSYELVNEPDVKFKFTNEEGKTFEPYFVRIGNHYQLDLGKLPHGVYQWEASTRFQNKNYQKSGEFIIREINIEQLNVQADHRLLMNIAENSGGEFFLPNELSSLQKTIENREDLVTVVYQEKSFSDLIDYKWLFFLIISLMTLEWFLRKFNGAY